jgi:hypothetical protein
VHAISTEAAIPKMTLVFIGCGILPVLLSTRQSQNDTNRLQ